MKKQLSFCILVFGLLATSACYRNDIRTETFQIDQLRSADALVIIQTQLRTLPGIEVGGVTADYEKRTLTIVFDGRVTYLKNIEHVITAAGFSLPHWPATPEAVAKLPKNLQQ